MHPSHFQVSLRSPSSSSSSSFPPKRFDSKSLPQKISAFSKHSLPKKNVVFLWQVIRGGELDIKVRITDPQGRVVLDEFHSENSENNEGEHEFFPEEKGDYEICFDNHMSTFSSKVVEFYLLTGHEDTGSEVEVHKPVPAALVNLFPTENSIDKVWISMTELRNHFVYFIGREARLRQTIDDTSLRLVYLTFLEAFALLGVSFAQIFFLKRFFEPRRSVTRP